MIEHHTVSLAEAQAIVAAGLTEAGRIGQPMNVAVVDSGGDLVAFARADGALRGSIAIAQDKAFTARAFDIATAELATLAQPGGQFYVIQQSNGGRVMIFAGGVPLKVGGTVVGAVGVSGGSGEQD